MRTITVQKYWITEEEMEVDELADLSEIEDRADELPRPSDLENAELNNTVIIENDTVVSQG